VQFDHRVLATLLFLIIPVFWLKARKLAGTLKSQPLLRTASHLLLAALALQITLGISTLLLVVPVALAAAHQAGAIILLTAALFTSQQFRR
jgi:cytochrome c oxidase assembly protein subunit 15